MKIKVSRSAVLIFLFFSCLVCVPLSAGPSDSDFTIINTEKISKFDADRVVYQHIEKTKLDEFSYYDQDDSISSLLIIKNSRMFLFRDGYDDPYEVQRARLAINLAYSLVPDLWRNKIDGSPDFLQITDRRSKILEKTAVQEPGKEPVNLEENFVKTYQELRNKFIENQAAIFRSILSGHRDSVSVKRTPLPKSKVDDPTKYAVSAVAKAIDQTVYFAEDADGDGITETFWAKIADGFSWGENSGPNVLLILNCRYLDDNDKEANADIKKLIGNLAQEAYSGTKEQEEAITKSLEKEKESIQRMIDDLYRTTK